MGLGLLDSSCISALTANYDFNLRNHLFASFLSQSSTETVLHSSHHMHTFSLWENTRKPVRKRVHQTVQKALNDPDNNNDVVAHHLETDILECEVKWALGSITKAHLSKTSGGDGIPAELFQILDDSVKVLHLLMPANLVNSIQAVGQGYSQQLGAAFHTPMAPSIGFRNMTDYFFKASLKVSLD